MAPRVAGTPDNDLLLAETARGTVRETILAESNGTYCPYFHYVVERIGRRWTGAILLVLSSGPWRFSSLRHQIPGHQR